MFTVGRYDPRAEDEAKRREKRRKKVTEDRERAGVVVDRGGRDGRGEKKRPRSNGLATVGGGGGDGGAGGGPVGAAVTDAATPPPSEGSKSAPKKKGGKERRRTASDEPPGEGAGGANARGSGGAPPAALAGPGGEGRGAADGYREGRAGGDSGGGSVDRGGSDRRNEDDGGAEGPTDAAADGGGGRAEELDDLSSSSAPSSSDDDSEDGSLGGGRGPRGELAREGRPALKVIAPEQRPPPGSERRGRRRGIADEGMDDFDIIEEGGGNPERGETGVIAEASSAHRHRDAEIATALRMSGLPIREAARVWDLAPFLIDNLEGDGYDRFFPIQSLVIPDVIASERHAQIRSRDICVSAPTGSGKTLAFVLPVLNALSRRRVRRLRALAVLPSRDLATQVYKVFDRYTHGSDLRIGLAIGQTDFESEQKSLILGSGPSNSNDADAALLRHKFDPLNPRLALEAFSGLPGDLFPKVLPPPPRAGRSAVDVLVATPGRLMDHLDGTPGFTLQHLRFLVIDEADRLVNQSYQNWIGRVADATCVAQPAARTGGGGGAPHAVVDPITWRRGMAGEGEGEGGTASMAASVGRPVPLRKLLFSATLTSDPQKLAALGLVNPKHFDAHHLNARSGSEPHKPQRQYSVPDGLSEFKVVCAAEQKPLVLLALLLDIVRTDAGGAAGTGDKGGPHRGGMVVVFTSSIDSTHRLARLLQLLWASGGYGPASGVAEFSSALSQKRRSGLLRRCTDGGGRGGGVSVVVCSDGMSRGMDLPSVSAVVNYDVPRYAKTYVHRCGRTARAGRGGSAISVLKGNQVADFRRMRRLVEGADRVRDMGVRKDLAGRAIPVYRACVRALRSVIEAEGAGELDPAAPLTMEWLPRRVVGDE